MHRVDHVAEPTAVSIPVEVILGVAGTLVLKAVVLTSRAVGEGHVIVRDVVEEVELVLVKHQASSNRVNGSVAPSLVEETTGVVQRGKEVDVCVRAQPVEVADLKVGPEMAVVVRLTTVVTEELHRVVLDDVLREVLGEVLGGIPEGGDGLDIFVQAESEAVLLLVLGHELEGVVVDVAVELNAGLDAPVPLVVEHQRVAEEETGLVAAHVPVADGVTVDDLLLLHLLADLGGLVLVNPLREGPVLLGDLAITGLAGNEGGRDPLELVVEVVVVEEDPVVVELAVEAVLDMADGLGNLPDILVAGKRNKGRVHAVAGDGCRCQYLLVGGCGGQCGCFGGEGGIGRGRGRGCVLVRWPAGRRDGRGANEVKDDKCLCN